MINYLKKNFFRIIGLLVLVTILFYFIPTGESHYLEPDHERLKANVHTFFLWAVAGFFILAFIIGLRGAKKIANALYLAFTLAIIGFSFFFLFEPIVYTATLYINRASGRDVQKTYVTEFTDPRDKNLLLWDNEIKRGIWCDELLKTSNTPTVAANDTVIVSFSKGLLGYNFNPKIKTIKRAYKAPTPQTAETTQ